MLVPVCCSGSVACGRAWQQRSSDSLGDSAIAKEGRMMTGTKRVYWDLPFDKAYSTQVLSSEFKDGQLQVVLKETIFHPEGGGQPSDTGVLRLQDQLIQERLGGGELAVSKVLEEGDKILHFVSLSPTALAASLTETAETTRTADREGTTGTADTEGTAGTPAGEQVAALLRGANVTCEIDWDLRFDLMQQHTGQHILSRAFEELLDAKTVGFHLSEEYVTIDLAIPSLSEEDAARVEDRANEIVFRSVPVFAKEYEAGKLPEEIRTRLPISAENIRVVYVGDFDACACGGTHVTSTGQVGLIKINQIDRAHGGVRVVFRCGNRALRDYRQKERFLSETAKILSQSWTSVPAAVTGLTDKVVSLEKSLEDARKALLEQEIAGMIREAAGAAAHEALVKHLPGKSVEELRMAVKRVSEAVKVPAVFFTLEPRFQAIVASSDSKPDARTVTARIASLVGARGGGTPQLAQVGSKEPLEMDENEVKQVILEALQDALNH